MFLFAFSYFILNEEMAHDSQRQFSCLENITRNIKKNPSVLAPLDLRHKHFSFGAQLISWLKDVIS